MLGYVFDDTNSTGIGGGEVDGWVDRRGGGRSGGSGRYTCCPKFMTSSFDVFSVPAREFGDYFQIVLTKYRFLQKYPALSRVHVWRRTSMGASDWPSFLSFLFRELFVR